MEERVLWFALIITCGLIRADTPVGPVQESHHLINRLSYLQQRVMNAFEPSVETPTVGVLALDESWSFWRKLLTAGVTRKELDDQNKDYSVSLATTNGIAPRKKKTKMIFSEFTKEKHMVTTKTFPGMLSLTEPALRKLVLIDGSREEIDGQDKDFSVSFANKYDATPTATQALKAPDHVHDARELNTKPLPEPAAFASSISSSVDHLTNANYSKGYGSGTKPYPESLPYTVPPVSNMGEGSERDFAGDQHLDQKPSPTVMFHPMITNLKICKLHQTGPLEDSRSDTEVSHKAMPEPVSTSSYRHIFPREDTFSNQAHLNTESSSSATSKFSNSRTRRARDLIGKQGSVVKPSERSTSSTPEYRTTIENAARPVNEKTREEKNHVPQDGMAIDDSLVTEVQATWNQTLTVALSTQNYSNASFPEEGILSRSALEIADKIRSWVVVFFTSFGIMGNIFNIKVLVNYPCSVSPYWMALSGVDLVFCLCSFIEASVELATEWHPVEGQTISTYLYLPLKKFLGFTAHRCSICFTAIIAIERFIAIRFPLIVKDIALSKNPLCFSLFVVFTISLCNCYHFFKYSIEERTLPGSNITVPVNIPTELYFSSYLDYYSVALDILTRFVPVAMVILFNILILVQLKKSQNFRKQHSNQSRGSSIQITKMLLIMSLVFIICVLPNMLVQILKAVLPQFRNKGREQHLYMLSRGISSTAEVINSSINILIYLGFNRIFRKQFMKLFCSLCFQDDAGNDTFDRSVLERETDGGTIAPAGSITLVSVVSNSITENNI